MARFSSTLRTCAALRSSAGVRRMDGSAWAAWAVSRRRFGPNAGARGPGWGWSAARGWRQLARGKVVLASDLHVGPKCLAPVHGRECGLHRRAARYCGFAAHGSCARIAVGSVGEYVSTEIGHPPRPALAQRVVSRWEGDRLWGSGAA